MEIIPSHCTSILYDNMNISFTKSSKIMRGYTVYGKDVILKVTEQPLKVTGEKSFAVHIYTI